MTDKLKATAHTALKHTLMWGITLLVGLILLFIGLLVRLNYKPIDLSTYLPALEEILHTEKMGGIDLDQLALSFDGDLVLVGEGVLFVGPDNSPVASAVDLRLSIALKSLLFGEIGFKKVQLNGLAMRVKQTQDYVQLGEYVMPKSTAPKPEGKKKFSVVGALSRIDDISYLKYLEVLEVQNTMVSLTMADEHFDVWNFSEMDLSFVRQKGNGEKMTLTGLMEPKDEATVPFYTTFEHFENEPTAYVSTRFEALHSRLFTAFLPEAQRSLIDTEIKELEVSATLNSQNTFREIDVEASMARGTINLPQIYNEPKKFRSAAFEFQVEPSPEILKLELKNLVIDAADDLLITGIGELRLPLAEEEADNIYTNLQLKLMAAPLASVMTILPDTKMETTLAWMRDNLNYDELMITNLHAQLTGYLKDFPFEIVTDQTPDSLFKVGFDFADLNVKTLEDMPPLTGAAGHLELLSDTITVTSEEGGMLGDQHAKTLHADVAGLFSPGQKNLRIRTVLEGEAQNALDILFYKLKIEPLVTNMKGTHNTTLELNVPLGTHTDEATPPAQATYNATTELKNVELILPFIAKNFKADQLNVVTSDKAMQMTGKGNINPFDDQWWNVDFLWKEQLETFGQKTIIEGQLTSTDTPMPEVFKKLGITVTGPLTHAFTFNRLGENKPNDVFVKTNLETAQIKSTAFDWLKDTNIPGSFELLAQFDDEMSYIDLQTITLRAPGAEVMGAFYSKINKEGGLKDMSFAFDPFIMGATNAAITYKDENYSLIGQSFNFSKIGSGELNTEMPIEDGQYTVDLKRLTFKGGKFENVLGYIKRTDNMWESVDFKALVGPNLSPLTLQLIPGDEASKQRRRFEMISGDAGSALKALNVYDNLSEGRLEAILNINHEYSAFGFDADGYILIEDVYLKNAPTMARLLSLVSLQQILKADKGIAFDKIKLPLLMDDRVLRVRKGKLKGPNIGMNLKGYVDFANNNMKFNGALIPATAVNTIVKNIPLVGPILTGSQGAIVAADFSVKGPIDKPEVSANPFSMVTPGIIKDIWDGISGDDTE